MDVGDQNLGAGGVVLELGNDGMGFGDSHVCTYREFGLGIQS
jgi:hypothetical protein